MVEGGLRRARDVRVLIGCGLRQDGSEWGGLLQRGQRDAILSQVGKAKCRKFGRIVVLAMRVQDVVVAGEGRVVVVVVVACVIAGGARAVIVVRLQGQRLVLGGAGLRNSPGGTGCETGRCHPVLGPAVPCARVSTSAVRSTHPRIRAAFKMRFLVFDRASSLVLLSQDNIRLMSSLEVWVH